MLVGGTALVRFGGRLLDVRVQGPLERQLIEMLDIFQRVEG
jgi:hypothetical protein